MVEHAGSLLRQRIAMDDVQDRRVIIGIEPPAGKLKQRPPPHLEPEEVAIESPRGLEVVAQDREVVHCSHTHAISPLPQRSIRETTTRKKCAASTMPLRVSPSSAAFAASSDLRPW